MRKATLRHWVSKTLAVLGFDIILSLAAPTFADDDGTDSLDGDIDVANGAIGSNEIANNSLTASDLAPNSVGNSELQDNAVGLANMRIKSGGRQFADCR